MGKTIMVSSHILPELADICNKIGIIERGELVVNSAVDEVIKQVRQSVVLNIRVAGEQGPAAELLAAHEAVERVDAKGDSLLVTLIPERREYSDLAALLIEHGFALLTFKEDEINLESAFMALTKGVTA